jgi:predicted dienelactone hydrolase
MNAGTYVAIALFMVGVIYHAGSTAQRIAALEAWREEIRDEFHELRTSIEELKDLIRGVRE